MWKKWSWVLVIALFIFSLSVKWFLAYHGRFDFSWDFGRDMLWVRQITVEHKPMLVGAWGSLDGTYFGPAYFYMLAVSSWISGGDPRAAVGMVSFLLSLMIPLGYWVSLRATKRHSFAIMVAIGLASLDSIFAMSLYSFPQQIVPLAWLFFLMSQWWYWQRPTPLRLGLMGFFVSLLFHFEPADMLVAGVVAFGLFAYTYKEWKSRWPVFIGAGIVGGLLPILPNIAFDFRHGFTQVRAFVALAQGGGSSLHGELPIHLRFFDRLNLYLRSLAWSLFASRQAPTWLLLGLGAGLAEYWRGRARDIAKNEPGLARVAALLAWNLVGSFIGFLIFSRLVKDFYLYFLPLIWLGLLATGLSLLWRREKQLRAWIAVGFAAMILFNLRETLIFRWLHIQSQTYAHQVEMVDDVYALAGGQPFRAYTYTAVIYDFPNQYLFSWYGPKKYGYAPVDFAYLPNQPEYVRNKTQFVQSLPTRADQGSPRTFFITETSEHSHYNKDYWFRQFEREKQVVKQYSTGDQILELIQK